MSLPRSLRDLRLRRRGPVGQALADWCARLARHAATQGRRKSRNPAIHQLRLVAKALRAALRLADEGDPAPDLIALDDAIRAASAAIAGSRDAVVLATLLTRLIRDADAGVQAAGSILASRWTAPDAGAGDTARAAESLVRLAQELGAALASRVSAAGIADCLRRSLRKVLRHQRRSRHSGEMDAFHAWRRWQKRLEAQMRLTSPGGGKASERRMERIHKLQELLGTLHDVDLLFLRLKEKGVLHGIPAHARKELLLRISDRQARLRKKVLRRGAAVFDGRTRKAIRNIARGWDSEAA